MHFPDPQDRGATKPGPHVRNDAVAPPRPMTPARPSARPRKRWGLRLGIAAAILASVAGAGVYARLRYLPSSAVLPGISIDGERVADPTSDPAVRQLAEGRARTLLGRKVQLAMPGVEKPVLETTLGELGLKVDVEQTVAVAERIGKTGDLLSRAEAAKTAREGGIDVPLLTSIDRAVAMPILEKLKETEDTQPVSARLDLEKHATIPEKEGHYIDIDATLARLEASVAAPAGGEVATRFELPLGTFAPRVSSAFLKSLDISTVVAEYETHFSRGGDQQRRGKNIDNAAQKLDGLVISPGELVSFNEVIGERSEANGFQKSWEIFKGEMVEGVGGGTCQVASTFHAAIFFGGFDVLERLPHSRPSAYIPMGLDSTVVFPAVDLKVRNPHPFPVVVHAKTEGGKLRVELLGKMKPVDVSFGRELVSTIPYKRKIVEEASLSGKKVLVKQHGIKGFKIKRSRVLRYPNGTSKKEETTDFYPPTTEIYHVPVGFDVAQLPPVPDGTEDSELGGNPSAAPAEARTPTSPTNTAAATACTTCEKPADGVEYVDSPGAHAPTSAQANPTKTIWVGRH